MLKNMQDFFHCLEIRYSELDGDKLEGWLIIGNYSDDEDDGGNHGKLRKNESGTLRRHKG